MNKNTILHLIQIAYCIVVYGNPDPGININCINKTKHFIIHPSIIYVHPFIPQQCKAVYDCKAFRAKFGNTNAAR